MTGQPGQMCWMALGSGDGEKILHLRMNDKQPWRPYTQFPCHKVPDYPLPRGSQGYATMQKLFKQGWTFAPSPKPEESVS